jgi:hypothetical protein
MFAWSQLDFSAIPVSIISAVSLTGRQTWQNVYNKRKYIRKSSRLAAFVFIPFVFGEKFPTAEFWTIPAETPCWEEERK